MASESFQNLQLKGKVVDLEFTSDADHKERKRSRATQSCLNCHTSKRKCDRKRPCQRCIQLGLTGLCVYDFDDPALSSETFTHVTHSRVPHSSQSTAPRGAPFLSTTSSDEYSAPDVQSHIDMISVPEATSSFSTGSGSPEEQRIDLSGVLPMEKGSCWTCRLRRKKCDEQREGGSCATCRRLGIRCLGWDSINRDRAAIDAYKAEIKDQLSRAGLIKGLPRPLMVARQESVSSYQQASTASTSDISSFSLHSKPPGYIKSISEQPPLYSPSDYSLAAEASGVPRSKPYHAQGAPFAQYLWDTHPQDAVLHLPPHSPVPISSPSAVGPNFNLDLTQVVSQQWQARDFARRLPQTPNQPDLAYSTRRSLVSKLEQGEDRQSLQEAMASTCLDRHRLDLNHDQHINTTFQVADLALSHVRSKEIEIQLALGRLRWEGSYFIQVGFDEEMLKDGHIVEQIHIYLDTELPTSEPHVIHEFSSILSPFTCFIHTPVTTHVISIDPPDSRDWHINRPEFKSWSVPVAAEEDAGGKVINDSDCNDSFRGSDDVSGQGGSSSTNQPMDIDSRSGGSGGGGSDGSDSGNSGSGGSGGSSGSGGSDSRGGGGGGGGSSGGGDGGGGEQGPDGEAAYNKDGRRLNFPFTSNLYDKDEGGNVRKVFTISSTIDIKIQENYDMPPANSNWLGPWFSISLDPLEGNAFGTYLPWHKYMLGLCQTQITGISEHQLSVVQYFPHNVLGREDTVKRREDKTTTHGAQFSTSPALGATATYGHVSSMEHFQRRWDIRTYSVDNDAPAGQGTGRAWKYAHNDDSLPRVPNYTFSKSNPNSASPSLVLGVDNTTDALPKLNVEVVMHWSLSPIKRKLFKSILAMLKSAKDPQPMLPLAFTDILHTTKISVDLRQFNERIGWANGIMAKDDQTLHPGSSKQVFGGQIQCEPKIFKVKVSAKGDESKCEVRFERAIYGRVAPLSQEKRTNEESVIPSTSSHMPFASSFLPTPSSSPSPTPRLRVSSPGSATNEQVKNGNLDSILSGK